MEAGSTIHKFLRALASLSGLCCADWVSEVDGVRLARALILDGYAYNGMTRLLKAGELIRVRMGPTQSARLRTR